MKDKQYLKSYSKNEQPGYSLPLLHSFSSQNHPFPFLKSCFPRLINNMCSQLSPDFFASDILCLTLRWKTRIFFSLLFNPLHSHVFRIQLRHMLWSIFVSSCHRWPTVGHFWMHDDFILGGGSAPIERYSLWHFDISLDFLFLVFLDKSPPIWHTVCGTDFHAVWCSFALPWRSFCDLCSSPLSWCRTCWVTPLFTPLYTPGCWKLCFLSPLVPCFFSWPSCLCWWSMASARLLKQGSMQVSFFSLRVCGRIFLSPRVIPDG